MHACVVASGAGRLPEAAHSLDQAAEDMVGICAHLWGVLDPLEAAGGMGAGAAQAAAAPRKVLLRSLHVACAAGLLAAAEVRPLPDV